ncbi:MAG: hypothetical protein ACON4Q_05340 [Candidatus Puniceispirillaceae bacterium]
MRVFSLLCSGCFRLLLFGALLGYITAIAPFSVSVLAQEDKPAIGVFDMPLPLGRLLQLPQDEARLQAILRQELEHGSAEQAFRIGLAYLDLTHLSAASLFLIIDAARLSGATAQGRQLALLAVRYHPENMDLYLQLLRLQTDLDNCRFVMPALRILKSTPPTNSAKETLTRYHGQLDSLHLGCSDQWQSRLQTEFGVARAPLAGTSAHGGAIIAKPGSALDDICVVLQGLCPPNRRFDLPQPKRHQLAHLSAQMQSRQTSFDGTHKIIGLSWYQERALSGAAESTHMAWQAGFGRLRRQTQTWLGFISLQAVSRSEEIRTAAGVNETEQAAYLQPGLGLRSVLPAYGPFRTDMAIAVQQSLLSSGMIRHLQTDIGLTMALTRQSQMHISSYRHWQIPPRSHLSGRSLTQGEKIAIIWQYNPRISVEFSHLKSTTNFAKTLPYLVRPHQVEKSENQLKIEYDITQNWSIYASYLGQKSRSEDQISQFSHTQNSIGIARKHRVFEDR